MLCQIEHKAFDSRRPVPRVQKIRIVRQSPQARAAVLGREITAMSRPNFDGPRWLYPVAYVLAVGWFGAMYVTVAAFGLLMGTWPERRRK